MKALVAFFAALIAAIFAGWQKVPAGIRAGVGLFVVGIVSTGMAFGWHWPADLADAKEQVAAFWLILVPAAYGLFQKTIWPPLWAWLLSLLALAPTIEGRALVPAWKPATAPVVPATPTPSLGRIVFYYDTPESAPLAAMIVHVWSKTMVNLCVFQSGGSPLSKTSVNHLSVIPGNAGMCWDWPPRV